MVTLMVWACRRVIDHAIPLVIVAAGLVCIFWKG